MARKVRWTNKSVLLMTGANSDPVSAIEMKARDLTLKAIDEGWTGPPFDPLALAKLRGLEVDARGDIPDARLVPINDRFRIEYNPTRPRGRLRFSIAHEIAHTLFPDCADEIRNRIDSGRGRGDDWQLEVLCNIAAAELLMPLGSFSQFASEDLGIDKVMELRRNYDVSVEACLIRLVKMAGKPGAAFCASSHEGAGYKMDYVIPAAGWNCPIGPGDTVPNGSAIVEADAIGFTVKADETWGSVPVRVECVGLAPYPGTLVPRVVGFLIPAEGSDFVPPKLEEIVGDLLKPRGTGPRVIAHVVPNTLAPWGGGGVAAAVKKKLPQVYEQFRAQLANRSSGPNLGEVVFADVSDGLVVANMVAQSGIGPSRKQRLNYAALSHCLHQVRAFALESQASVHVPRLGTGHGGAKWEIIRELLIDELVVQGVPTMVYSLPLRT